RGVVGGVEGGGVGGVCAGGEVGAAARRPIAVVGFEIDGTGATLIEAVLSLERDQSLLPHLLDRADPPGVVGAGMVLPGDVTSLAQELGRVPGLDEVVAWLRPGYEARLGIRLAGEAAPRARALRPDLDRHGVTATMLGRLEAHCAMAADGTLAEVMLAGDFLAPSPTIDRLERALRGCRPDVAALEEIVAGVVRPPEDF